MAKKRMFNISVVDSDAFLDMPLSAQALYFHLNMRADDDGFIGNPKRIQRLIGSSDDDLKLLFLKRFILTFEDGVIVIKHWRMHNTIRQDRYTPTVYQEELKTLGIKANKSYTLAGNQMATNGLPNASTDIDIGIDIDKDLDIDKELHNAQSDNIACEPVITITLNDKSEYPIYQHMIDEWIELYPNVEVMQELRNMKGWCSANPERRKTKRGILRFIVGWLSREQDKPKVNKKVPEWFNQTSDESVKDVDDAEIENMQRMLGGKK